MWTWQTSAAGRRGLAGVVTMIVAGAAWPAGGQITTLVSSDSGGTAGSGASAVNTPASVSWFGRYVLFVSDSPDLVGDDTNGVSDVFVHDRQTGTTVAVSRTTSGVIGNGASGWGYFGTTEPGAAMSPDGRHVVFISRARNLAPGKTSDLADVFLHDRDTDLDGVFDEAGAISTQRVSIDTSGGDPDDNSSWPAVDYGGRYVVFASRATDLVSGDGNGVADIFFYNVATGTTLRISNGVSREADGPSWAPMTMLFDSVMFTSDATNLVNGDTNGAADVFVYRYGGGITRVSVATDGSEASGISEGSGASLSGRYIVFSSTAEDLVGAADSNMMVDVFVHDRDTDQDAVFDEPGAISTRLVSLATGGAQGNGHSGGGVIDWQARYVAFKSGATNLGSDGDTNVNVFLRDLQTGQTNIVGVVPSGGRAVIGPGVSSIAMSPEGGTIAFANYNDSPQQAYLRDTQTLDTEGDGLLDSWEIIGIDANADGVTDLTLPNANGFINDVYVEIDAMTGMLPSAATLNTIDRVFNGSDGVPADLHLLVDETSIPVAAWTSNGITWPPEFGPLKLARFGTPAERASGNWANIRAAKLMAHRYCVFADRLGSTTVSGMGEMPGNDFFVTLGAWAPGSVSPSVQIGLFLHELGHNLGLDHGGGAGIASVPQRSVNYKPNYHSVMNYTWTVPQTPYAGSWFPGYSSLLYNVLNEMLLDENVGIGGYPNGFVVPAGPPPSRLVAEAGPVDWNRNGVATEWNAAADINWLSATQGVNYPFDWHDPHLDWNNMWWRLSGNTNFAAGVHGAVIPSGMEYDEGVFLALERIAGGGWLERFETYAPGRVLDAIGGWETWCDGGRDATVDPIIFRSPPSSLMISFDGTSQYGSDVVKRFHYDRGRCVLSVWTYVPGFATGSGYIIGLNQYCQPEHNWSMQVQFDATAGVVREFSGPILPLVRDQWVEFRAEIDLDRDRLTEYYGGQLLATDLVWSQNVSGQFGDPGITSIAALDLFSENIPEMFFDDLSMEVIECPPDVNGDGVVNSQDFFDFLGAFFTSDPAADYNGDGAVNSQDFFDFLTGFFGGCE